MVELGGVPGHSVLVVTRTFFAGGRPVETADIVLPADRFRVSYHMPVR
jgi:DNA-binding GntR family transcriptional regulator